ncbi:hypothetical protein HPB52_021302 [Rhipicephalus sanguineus]|uniref:Uncharacterized protein n=1 Tax=Rhipicephalus sanguineus TaxID=34632 RepID=A0A9D4Q3P7_RHISA|nr:hypothetical protein HPB52_021302 [Rhipicephalus sanguineus]
MWSSMLSWDGTVSTNGGVARTDSPDNDSAFSDNVSMLSSESSASSGGGNNVPRTEPKANSGLASSPCQLLEAINVKLRSIQAGIELDTPPPAEQAARLKAEKIRIALEKMKEASVQKVAFLSCAASMCVACVCCMCVQVDNHLV